MKILIVSQQPAAYEKWIEPLRKEGTGVMRVQTLSDAEQVLKFHGSSIDAIVIHAENEAAFKNHAQWKSIPRVVTPVVESGELTRLIQVAKKTNQENTKSNVSSSFPLEDVSRILARPEQTRSIQSSSIKLKEPTIIFSSKDAKDSLLGVAPELAAPTAAAASPKAGPKIVESTVMLQRQDLDDQADQFKIEKVSKPAVEATVMLERDEATRMVERTRALSNDEATRMVDRSESVAEVQSFDPIDLQKEDELIASLASGDDAVELPVYKPASPGLSSVTHTSTYQTRSSAAPLRYTGGDYRAAGNSAAESADIATLKNYLSMREQDVAVLTGQLRSAQEHINNIEKQFKVERVRSVELQHLAQRHESQLKSYDRDKRIELETFEKQIEDLNHQLKQKNDQFRSVEARLKISTEEVEKVKERVRVDIRRIRVREKELEAQLEVLKKDSSALLLARDQKITELKRKLDLLEFNMELVQEQYAKERKLTDQLKQKLKDAAFAMKQANGLLDHEH
jgi:hypothetical protein